MNRTAGLSLGALALALSLALSLSACPGWKKAIVAFSSSAADASKGRKVIRARPRGIVPNPIDVNTLVDAVRRSRARVQGADEDSS